MTTLGGGPGEGTGGARGRGKGSSGFLSLRVCFWPAGVLRMGDTARTPAAHCIMRQSTSETMTEDNALLSEYPEFKTNIEGLSQAEAGVLLARWGGNALPSTDVPVWKQILKLLTQPMAIMMWIAAVIEALIQNWPDMGILLLIIFTNATISFYEMRKSGNAVAALQAAIKPEATVKRDGVIKNINAEELVPGDAVLLASGSAVPADCRLNEGEITVDQAALTGESMPVKIKGDIEASQFEAGKTGDHHAKMGTTVMTGEEWATVEFTGIRTMLGQTAALLDRPQERSNLDKVLFRIIMIMVGMSIMLSSIVFIFGMSHKGETFRDVLSFTVVLIIASIPMAVEIVTTTTLALGARTLAAEGAIVTRLSSVEDMAAMKLLCSDKTGTLTLGKMQLCKAEEHLLFGDDVATVLQVAAMAAKWKEPPRDAIDKLVLQNENAKIEELVNVEQTDFLPFDPSVKRTEARVVMPEGLEKHGCKGAAFKVSKGAPDIIINMCEKANETEEKVKQARDKLDDCAKRGIRCLALAKAEILETDESQWRLVALLTFTDPPRPDSKQTILTCKDELGVPVRMITGDLQLIAKETCRQLGLKDDILSPAVLTEMQMTEDGGVPDDVVEKFGKLVHEADGFAQVYPHHKFLIVHTLRKLGLTVGMTGDGVNDAAALKEADVGVCVQGGTDAARAAADIVLTQEGLSTIVNGIKLSRQIFARINNFMTYRLAASMQLLFYFFIAVLTMHPSAYHPDEELYASNASRSNASVEDVHEFEGVEDVTTEWQADGGSIDRAAEYGTEWPYMYGMPVLLLMTITLLNDGSLITIGYDRVEGSPQPTSWNIRMLFLVSFVLAAVACVSSLWLLHMALDSWREGSTFRSLGLEPMSLGHMNTLMYLKVSVSQAPQPTCTLSLSLPRRRLLCRQLLPRWCGGSAITVGARRLSQVSDFLTLFSARAGKKFWFQSRPALIVVAAAAIALGTSTFIACQMPITTLDKMAVEGLSLNNPKGEPTAVFVWLYCIFW